MQCSESAIPTGGAGKEMDSTRKYLAFIYAETIQRITKSHKGLMEVQSITKYHQVSPSLSVSQSITKYHKVSQNHKESQGITKSHKTHKVSQSHETFQYTFFLDCITVSTEPPAVGPLFIVLCGTLSIYSLICPWSSLFPGSLPRYQYFIDLEILIVY
jgi:hypothetical protein